MDQGNHNTIEIPTQIHYWYDKYKMKCEVILAPVSVNSEKEFSKHQYSYIFWKCNVKLSLQKYPINEMEAIYLNFIDGHQIADTYQLFNWNI